MIERLKHFNSSSPGKYQRALSFVQIYGELTPESPQVDLFITLSIMVKESIAMKKEVISVWKDSGSSLNDSRPQKEEYDGKNCLYS